MGDAYMLNADKSVYELAGYVSIAISLDYSRATHNKLTCVLVCSPALLRLFPALKQMMLDV